MSAGNTTEAGLRESGEGPAGSPLGSSPQKPKRNDKVARMGTASVPRLVLEFAIPSIIGMVVNGAYNVIDSIFLGQAIGEIGLETMTVANPTMIVFMAVSMLVGVGGNALAALRLGEGKKDSAEHALGNTFFLCLVASLIVAFVGLNPTTLHALLSLSSSTEAVLPYAESFVRIVCVGYVFQCVGMGINNFIRTAGAPNRALGTMLIGAISCTIFNYFFVLKFGWGVEGSAWATVCGQAISCATVLWYFIFTKGVPFRLRLSQMKPRIKTVGTILSFGLPSFFIQIGGAVVSFAMNYFLVLYGASHFLGSDLALTSIGVVQRLSVFAVLPIIGVAVAIQPLLGFNYGARFIGRVRSILWVGVIVATIIGLLTWSLIHIFPEPIVKVFGISEEGLLDFTVFALKVQLSMLPFIGFQAVGSNYFQATGQPLKSVILTLTRQILFLLPLLFVLPETLPKIVPSLTSLDALYFATPISDILAIVTAGFFIFVELRRLKKLEAEYASAGKATQAGSKRLPKTL